MANKKLLAIGEALIDFIPDKTGCAFADVTAFLPRVGGAPANVCGAFAKLGGRAMLISQLGDDPFGHKIADELTMCGVDTSAVAFTTAANTALAFVSLSPDGNRTFSFYRKPSADMLFTPEQVKACWFDDAYVLHFCSVSLGDFPMKDAHERAIAFARERGVLISFDPNLRFPLWNDHALLRRRVNEFLPRCDVLKISDEELEFLTGEREITLAAPALLAQGVRLLLYTCGSGGAYAFTRTAQVFSPALPVRAVDTTGAGDGFIGAFLWELQRRGGDAVNLDAAENTTLRACLDFANRFCARSIQSPGALASYPRPEEMETAEGL